LLVVGAAAGAAAITWLNRRRLSVVNTSSDELIEPESAELPVGRSADPDVDADLSRQYLPQDDTTGGALYAERESLPSLDEPRSDALEDIWNPPGAEEGERGEAYDAVNPESLGAVWLERATQTTHDARLEASDPSDLPELEGLTVSEASLSAAGLDGRDLDDNDLDADDIGEDDLGDDLGDDGEDGDEQTDSENREDRSQR